MRCRWRVHGKRGAGAGAVIFQGSLISFFLIFLNIVSMLHKLSYYSIMTPIKYPYDRGQLYPAGFFSPFEPSALSFVLFSTEKHCSLKDKEMRNIDEKYSVHGSPKTTKLSEESQLQQD